MGGGVPCGHGSLDQGLWSIHRGAWGAFLQINAHHCDGGVCGRWQPAAFQCSWGLAAGHALDLTAARPNLLWSHCPLPGSRNISP